jgi:iron(III) transport system substrate-binding protein
MKALSTALSLVAALLTVVLISNVAKAELTIYTDRPTARVQPVADEFAQMTGEQVVIVEMSYSDMLNRLRAEGPSSAADVLFVKDLVYLTELSSLGFFQPLVSTFVDQEIAPQMKDPKNLWTAVTIRARTLVYDPSRVQAGDLKGYEDLADAKWAGRLCLRTSKSAYNEALVAGLIEVHGAAKAKSIVEGWVQNLAVDPLPNDNAVLEAVANGNCDVGLANTYYLGAAIAKNPAFPVRAFFADQSSTGVFGNGTGAGVSAFSTQSALATRFIELLLSEKHQIAMSAANFDYPAKLRLAPTTLVKDWGTPKYNDANWTKVGNHAAHARLLFSDLGYK